MLRAMSSGERLGIDRPDPTTGKRQGNDGQVARLLAPEVLKGSS